jgi:2-methylisocitrate lyase-like PEP mutase family enzyme
VPLALSVHQTVFRAWVQYILYPTSILFRMTKGTERAASDLKNRRQLSLADAVEMKEFEEILGLNFCAQIKNNFPV